MQTEFESEDMYLKSVNKIINTLEFDQSFKYYIKSLNANYPNTDQSFLQIKIDNFTLETDRQGLVYLELLDNYFFLTEDFICFSDSMIKDYKL